MSRLNSEAPGIDGVGGSLAPDAVSAPAVSVAVGDAPRAMSPEAPVPRAVVSREDGAPREEELVRRLQAMRPNCPEDVVLRAVSNVVRRGTTRDTAFADCIGEVADIQWGDRIGLWLGVAMEKYQNLVPLEHLGVDCTKFVVDYLYAKNIVPDGDAPMPDEDGDEDGDGPGKQMRMRMFCVQVRAAVGVYNREQKVCIRACERYLSCAMSCYVCVKCHSFDRGGRVV